MAQESTNQGKRRDKGNIASTIKCIPTITWGLILLIVFLGFFSPRSIAPNNMLNFTRQSAALIIVALGQTIVMMIGGLDLSVGAVITLIDVVAAQNMKDNILSMIITALVCLLIGAVIGIINGGLCVYMKLPAFIATLGTGTLIKGITLIYSGGSPNGSIPSRFRFWGTGFVGIIPASAFVWALVAVIMIILVNHRPIGHYIINTGANDKAVQICGIDDRKIKLCCYMISAILAAVSGLVLSAYIGTGSLDLGTDYQLRSIATAVLGGASFAGGEGSMAGTIIASFFMVVMSSFIAVLNLPSGWQSIIQGLIIFIGLLVNYFKKTE